MSLVPSDIPRIRKSILANNAGALRCTRARSTGGLVTLYRAEAQGMDVGGEPYALVCESHSSLVGVPTQKAGRDFACAPEGWCEDCREITDARSARSA